MEATAQPTAASPKLKNGRGAASNDPWRLGRQTPRAIARRRRDLMQAFISALGGPEVVSPMVLLQIKKGAELLALAESVRAGLFNCPTRDVTGLVRLEGEARRTLAALGLRAEPPPPPPRGLERARQRWAQQETTKTTKAAKADRRETKPHAKRRERPPGRDQTQESD
jgi:hypothetical protein